MGDDHQRLERLEEERRTDVHMGHRVQRFVEALQEKIVRDLESVDGAGSFRRDEWEREEGGGGITRVLEEGTVFERAGVNTSAVHGPLPEKVAANFDVEPGPFFATGISIVIHPRSPWVPTFHANLRYFALGEDLFDPDDEWFGGGADLTPYYPFLEDVRHFHGVWREVCENHEVADYAAYKKACDEYFYVAHREEARGVGGLFFDYERNRPEATFFFGRELARRFMDAYLPIVRARKDREYGARERHYQCRRRGRYVEFNLVYDRGTRFGLLTRGRTESILMSMPPNVEWRYDWTPEPGTKEARAQWFFEPRNWLNLSEEELEAGRRHSPSET